MNWWVMSGAGCVGFFVGTTFIIGWIEHVYPNQWKRILEIDRERRAIRTESRMRRRAVK
jgi:hypothetical protein